MGESFLRRLRSQNRRLRPIPWSPLLVHASRIGAPHFSRPPLYLHSRLKSNDLSCSPEIHLMSASKDPTKRRASCRRNPSSLVYNNAKHKWVSARCVTRPKESETVFGLRHGDLYCAKSVCLVSRRTFSYRLALFDWLCLTGSLLTLEVSYPLILSV